MLNQKGIAPLAIAIALAVIILVAGGIYLTLTQKNQELEEEWTAEDEERMSAGETVPELPDDLQPGLYADYSSDRVEEEQNLGKKVVLYFWAAWCPECRAADADFTANSDKIPAGIALLKLNYDTETELKQKYGVTYQHTFVQIDNNGNLVTKWISGDTDLLEKNIK